jgi:hypothetical protein
LALKGFTQEGEGAIVEISKFILISVACVVGPSVNIFFIFHFYSNLFEFPTTKYAKKSRSSTP